MVIETKIQAKLQSKKTQIYNIKDKQAWQNFNKDLVEETTNKESMTYTELGTLITKCMKRNLKLITVNKGQYKPKTNEKIKELKAEKKTSKKEFENATPEEKKEKLDKYIQAQKRLRLEVEEHEKCTVEEKIQTIAREGRSGSDRFWKIRRKIVNQGGDENYDLITEENKLTTDPEESKEYIANFYQNLYKAREGTEQYQHWTDHITNTVKELDDEWKTLPQEPEITEDELKKAIKGLKRGKSTGPDGIPNEMFIESNEQTRALYLKVMNQIIHSAEIPQEWKEGKLKSLYKG